MSHSRKTMHIDVVLNPRLLNYATLTGALTLGVLSAPLVDSPTTAAVAAAVGDETAGAKIGPEDRTELLLGDLRRGLADWTASKVDL